MRLHLAFAALMLPLAGCVVAPANPYYAPAFVAPAEFGYPGYAYNGGSPTLVVGGATWPLIFYGGGWGYWDGYHRWHRAPDAVWRHLDQRHPGGAGYRAFGGGGYGRPGGPVLGGRAGYRPGAGAYAPRGQGGRGPAQGGQHRWDRDR